MTALEELSRISKFSGGIALCSGVVPSRSLEPCMEEKLYSPIPGGEEASLRLPPSPTRSRKVFFNRKHINKNKLKPKPLVYHVFLCSKCKPIEDDTGDVGAWSALIVRQPQDAYGGQQEPQTTYIVSGTEKKQNHIRIRLSGVKESLKWIVSNMEEVQYPAVEAVYISNDIFIVNMLREWLPKWYGNKFRMDKHDETVKRPNADILEEIGAISTKIKLSIRWQAETSHDMSSIARKVDESLARL